MKALIDELNRNKALSKEKWIRIFDSYTKEDAEYAAEIAREIAKEKFGNKIFFRGIIEFTNFCKNDCFYCGLRCSAKPVDRYRLSSDEIMECCSTGYKLGYRTFVLQGGEDPYFNDERVIDLIKNIKEKYPDTALTLSIGEKSRETYKKFYDAGADRYLLRHETASKEHYEKLHPGKMSFENRMECLHNLKDIGYQTGCGMMIGSPFQTSENLEEDMLFIEKFRPHMLGIGPFRSHHLTPFQDYSDGSVELTLFILSLCRIMQPEILLPATTALDCGEENGRQRGILAGANVMMPNLSPTDVRKDYLLYDGKPGLDLDSEENLMALKSQIEEIGYELVVGRGDYSEKSDKLF